MQKQLRIKLGYYIVLVVIAVLVLLINTGNMVWWNLFGSVLFGDRKGGSSRPMQ